MGIHLKFMWPKMTHKSSRSWHVGISRVFFYDLHCDGLFLNVSVQWVVDLFQQDYTKTTELIFKDTWIEDGSQPRKDPIK